ncbi:MAG: transposase [Parachlamydiaceae bacterium]|nr:transposase [Parachlamydiaceae bacterium]
MKRKWLIDAHPSSMSTTMPATTMRIMMQATMPAMMPVMPVMMPNAPVNNNRVKLKVLHIVIEEIRQELIACYPEIPDTQIGAVSFIQNFGSTLNVHPHFHLVVTDGVFFYLRTCRGRQKSSCSGSWP